MIGNRNTSDSATTLHRLATLDGLAIALPIRAIRMLPSASPPPA
ncbi:hypothetical protein [Xanthomonas campestris]|nr:hypothetical protein [Xanthomonas campestris]